MDYYKDLKREDFASVDDYLLERVKRGLAAGFTFQQCRHHHFIDFSLALGLSQADILDIVGSDTGYIFPDEYSQKRGNGVDRAIGVGSRQRSLPV